MKSLDQNAGRERPGLYVKNELDLYSMTSEKYVSDHDGHYKNRVHDLQEDNWIPCIVAAHLAGVSKQAISDRIKRGTLEAREAHRKSWWGGNGGKVVLIRHGDAMRKKKAGRPKGSGSRKRSRDSSGTKREGFEIPVYFKLFATYRDGCTEKIFLKIHEGYRYRYTDETFTRLDPTEEYDTIPETNRSITGAIKSMRSGEYCHHHKCTCRELTGQFANPLTAPAVDLEAMTEIWEKLSKKKKGVIHPQDLLEASKMDTTLAEFFPVYDQVCDYLYG